MPAVAESARPPATSLVEGWQVLDFATIDSTNTRAGSAAAWTAVRADTQSAGRGRTRGRHWVSDAGGLWLSAVVPCPGPRTDWEILPLAAGWALLGVLRDLGVTDVRLRWPNDLMAGRRKLAGLLVERYTADTAVIGIGLNVFNQPELADPAVADLTARLADLVPEPRSLDEVTALVLRALRRMHEMLLRRGFAGIADELNLGWANPRRVALTLHGHASPFDGWFHGIDTRGRLRVTTTTEGPCAYDATQVALLRELP